MKISRPRAPLSHPTLETGVGCYVFIVNVSWFALESRTYFVNKEADRKKSTEESVVKNAGIE